MSTLSIVGINWGDEGKGRMVDLLAQDYDIVVRYQGGGNAGHTVINEFGKFALHLLPSGIFHKDIVNILGNGVALDPENLLKEIEAVRAQGVRVTPDNLKISERCSLLLPWHRDMDGYEEERLGAHKYGSTRQGIAPFYSDKYRKKTVMAGELFYPDHLREHLDELLEWKNVTLEKVYDKNGYTVEQLNQWIETYCDPLKPFITDTTDFLIKAQKDGKNILFESQLGTLRDLDYGIYPYTTSSNTLARYAPIGSGLPSMKTDRIIGVVKAYSTCVGEGPFVGEMSGEDADRLREAGSEYGAKTGRARRVAPLDLVATKYGVHIQGASEIALTKLDILSYMEKIPVITGYRIDGQITDRFPFPVLLEKAEPVISYVEGFHCDISQIREYDHLPQAARDYIKLIEETLEVPVTYISVGPARESIIRKQA